MTLDDFGMEHNIRWEVRYFSVTGGKEKVHCRETRKNARALMRVMKNHPLVASNVRMYRVSEFLDEQRNPVMTFHRRAR